MQPRQMFEKYSAPGCNFLSLDGKLTIITVTGFYLTLITFQHLTGRKSLIEQSKTRGVSDNLINLTFQDTLALNRPLTANILRRQLVPSRKLIAWSIY